MAGSNPRGTSNKNVRGSWKDVCARKHYLLVTYESDEGPGTCRCYRCGDLLDWWLLTVDRIKPGCEGGTYRRENIRPACAGCNELTGRLLGQARRRAKIDASVARKSRRVVNSAL